MTILERGAFNMPDIIRRDMKGHKLWNGEIQRKDGQYEYKYTDAIFLLFKTGLRISEFAGLNVKDIDFVNNRINVDHQLQRTNDMEYLIQTTKTVYGTRMIPMIPEVREALERIIKNRKKPKVEPIIDGKSGFVYLDKKNMPMVALHWEKYFKRITDKYNGIYKVQLPKVTPHVCRHIFCSNMAKSGMNPKTFNILWGIVRLELRLIRILTLDMKMQKMR